jgi:hypothetical protein
MYLGRYESEFGVTVRFNYTASTGDHYDKSMGCYYPGDGEEIEITSIDLFETPEPNAKKLECPAWLYERIEAQISNDDLREVAAEDHAASMEARAEARASA